MFRDILGKIDRHRPVAAASLVSLFLVAGGWAWSYFALRGTDQPLILHFNNLAGIDQVGGLGELIPVGLFGLILTALGSILALELEEKDWFLGKFTAAAVFGFAALIFIGFAAIISVN